MERDRTGAVGAFEIPRVRLGAGAALAWRAAWTSRLAIWAGSLLALALWARRRLDLRFAAARGRADLARLLRRRLGAALRADAAGARRERGALDGPGARVVADELLLLGRLQRGALPRGVGRGVPRRAARAVV